MTNWKWKSGILAAGVLMLAACGSDVDVEESPGLEDRSGDAMAEVIGDVDGLGTLAQAFERTGLTGVLEGEANYTVFAPTEAAFEGLGGDATAMLENEETGALVAAVLREHMVPGALTPDAIREAIEANGGEVTMVSFGADALTLTMNGETITVTNGSGASARLMGEAIVASNGVVLPIDAVLTDPAALAPPDQ